MPHQPPHPPPEQPWIPPAPGPMDIVPPSEDSNSQDSGEFAPDNRHIFSQNNHNFGGPPPDNFAMGPVNQFDYQVKHFLLKYCKHAEPIPRSCASSADFQQNPQVLLFAQIQFVICKPPAL